MKPNTNIIIGLILSTTWACNYSNTQTANSGNNKSIVTHYNSNFTLENGRYRIDTNAILSNHNLTQLISELEKVELVEETKVDRIPSFIKSFLDTLTEGFSIANPNEDWQSACTSMSLIDEKGNIVTKRLPRRQLVYLGIGEDIALMTYYSGGYATIEHCLIFKFDNNHLIDFWCGHIINGKSNKEQILNYLKANKAKHWGLNTNIIYL